MNAKTKKFNDEFKKVKSKIALRDGWKCLYPEDNHQGCLDVDHIIRRSIRGKNNKENLITVCRYHHTVVETMPINKKVKLLRSILKKKYNYNYSDKYENNS